MKQEVEGGSQLILLSLRLFRTNAEILLFTVKPQLQKIIEQNLSEYKL